MPNTFAYIALIVWPLYSLYLFKKKEALTAVFITIVGGYLILPVKVFFDFPLIPPLDKNSIVSIIALVGCVYVKRIKIPVIPKKGLERVFVIILLLSPILTVLNNQDRIYDLDRNLPGLTYHDALSMIINQYIVLIPFFLGLQLVKSRDDVNKLLKFFVISCLLYSLLILIEIRMSPQLHSWLYGFFPHNFGQTKRLDGFRAVVFLGHGLLIAMFVAISLASAAILWKEKIKIYNFSPVLIILFLFTVLILSKSMAAFLLGSFLMIAISWMPISIVKRSSWIIVFVIIFYPALSLLNIFPHQGLVELAASIDVDRAQSLAFRFDHEERLLDHAQEKIFFGWGGWGRNRLADSVTDGLWILSLGTTGLVGFISLFGLFTFTIRKAIKASDVLTNKKEKRLILSFALIISIILIDQLLNASLNMPVFLLAGALLGFSKEILLKKNNILDQNASKKFKV